MEINKQLFEDVLSGKLKGTFVFRNQLICNSDELTRNTAANNKSRYPYCIRGWSYTRSGIYNPCSESNVDIIDFIPDTNIKENELIIKIPNNKVVDWDESKKQNKIVLKDKQLTYEDICKKLFTDDHYCIGWEGYPIKCCSAIYNANNATTKYQLECILAKNKLATVARYLNDGWKPYLGENVWYIMYYGEGNFSTSQAQFIECYCSSRILFKKEILAQQAIEILGEETVKLALEPLGYENMIKETMIYETTDGCRFNTEKAAKEYEVLYEKCEKIMGQLHPHEDNGAVQQDIELVKNVFNEFMDLCVETIPSYKKTFIGVKEGNIHPSWAQRVISDYGIDCLLNASFRFSCINMVSGIEYEQPYYVNHESEWNKNHYGRKL